MMNRGNYPRGQLSRLIFRRGVGSLMISLGLLCLQFLATTILARTLGPAEFGLYSFVLAIVTLLAIPAQLGLPSLVLRETAASVATENWGLMKGLWRWSALFVLCFSLCAAALGLIVGSANALDLGTSARSTLFLGLLLVPVLALGNLRGAALRGLGHVVIGQLPENTLRPALFVILLLGWLGSSGPGHISPVSAMGMNVCAAGTAFFVGLVLLKQRQPPEVASGPIAIYQTRRWLASMLMLGAISAVQVIIRNTDVVMLGIAANTADVGVYKVVSQAAIITSFGLSAANLAIAPQVAKMHENGELGQLQHLITNCARWVLVFSIPIAVGYWFFGGWLLKFLFGVEFARGKTALAILAFGQVVNSGFGPVGLLLNMTRNERDTLKGMAVAAVLNVGLNALLIPRLGVDGAALGTAASLVLWNLLLWRKVKSRLGIDSLAFRLPGGRVR